MPAKPIARPASIALAVLLTLLGLWIGWQATVRILVDVKHRQLTAVLQDWQAVDSRPSADAWRGARTVAGQALALAPDHPGLLLDAGKVDEFAPFEADWQKYQQTALEHYRRSVQLRPTWPFGWSLLAYGKYRLGEVDDEFQLAFARAVNNGRWVPEIQINMTHLGFRAWEQLNPENRRLAAENLKRGIKRKPGDIFRIAEAENKTRVYCLVSYQVDLDLHEKYCK